MDAVVEEQWEETSLLNTFPAQHSRRNICERMAQGTTVTSDLSASVTYVAFTAVFDLGDPNYYDQLANEWNAFG